MRHVIFKDTAISREEFHAWRSEDQAFWETYCGITPTYWMIDHDFSFYPTYLDTDGDVRPTKAFLTKLTDQVFEEYDEFGTDFVIPLIHEDNWRSAGPLFDELRAEVGLKPKLGIWGTNWSYIYRSYHVEYCRWDRDNPANRFGTLYHERVHPVDALVRVELDVQWANRKTPCTRTGKC